MRYVRIAADAAGASHFEDVEPATGGDSGQGWGWLSEPVAVDRVIFRRVEGGDPPAWHVAPRRQFIVHLVGSVEVQVSDGEVRRFGPGSVVLVEDTWGQGHLTRPVDGESRTTLFIPLAGDLPPRA